MTEELCLLSGWTIRHLKVNEKRELNETESYCSTRKETSQTKLGKIYFRLLSRRKCSCMDVFSHFLPNTF